jgi:DNA (cytosine-5)-methyltransferase 1
MPLGSAPTDAAATPPSLVDVEGFAGPGGWSEGRRLAGAAHRAIGFDIDSAACRTAVAAGHTRVRADVSRVSLAPMAGRVDGVLMSPPCKDWSPTGTRLGAAGRTGHLIAEPLRWCRVLLPRWTAWECSATLLVQSRFEADAAALRELGYHVWTGVLNAADYGVPQTRRRAVLVAHRDRPVGPPPPEFGGPISMSDALGWSGAELVSNYGTNGDARNRGRRGMHQPAFTITGKCGRNYWEWPDGTARRLSVAEAGQLQTFPADYPWQGGSIIRQQQVGDAMPPLLAAAILRGLVATAEQMAA